MTHDIDIRPQCFGSYGSFHGEPVKCSPAAGCGLKGCPWQRQIESKPTETVYAHVERTVHALLDAITRSLPAAISSSDEGVTPEGIKMLAEAVQALAAWRPAQPFGIALETSR